MPPALLFKNVRAQNHHKAACAGVQNRLQMRSRCSGARALTDKLGLIRMYQGFLPGEYALQPSEIHLSLRSGWCLTASSQYTCNHRCLLAFITTAGCPVGTHPVVPGQAVLLPGLGMAGGRHTSWTSQSMLLNAALTTCMT